MQLSVLIVDDEQQVRNAFLQLLQQFCPYAAVKGVATNIDEALVLIYTQKIDVVFLDINLGGHHTGFDLLDRVHNHDFDVVFVTAHAEHAVKAFEYAAVHYLLKPVDYRVLMETMDRIRKKKETAAAAGLQHLTHTLHHSLLAPPPKIALSDNNATRFVSLDEIAYLESKGSYTIFHLQDRQRYTKSRNLKYFEDALQPHTQFVRVHKSFIVNRRQVKAYRKASQDLEFFNGEIVPMSIGYRAFMEQSGDHFIQ